MQAQLIEEREFYSVIKMQNNEYWARKNFKIVGKFNTLQEAKNFIKNQQKEDLENEQNPSSR
ncbi:hypothetical protein Calab_1474 [Caldithrix abyssi DSM 13497]|uniref:Uncharacterized protein n=1 Tax=Caldithrix abyssi DSM 13497 TaxID=880073 RepID=H1XPW9_CALAY|nr:hypothetical protein [Caldithrix abyssi]APF20376.1 hypothetical protein Cabys_3630 [Caldithrix abyssi DSM 13497]EHO41095.1 hypothetical protein Calab_1474 [Caldithrix abyssi DSM 13497]